MNNIPEAGRGSFVILELERKTLSRVVGFKD